MFVTISTPVKAATLVRESFRGGVRIAQAGMKPVSPGRIFGAVFGLCFVGAGIGILLVTGATMPGSAPVLRAVIAAILMLFGGFILWAAWQNLSSTLEIDFTTQELRHFRTNAKGQHKSRVTIPFADVKGVFTEGKDQDPSMIDHRADLIITYWSGGGYGKRRLDAFSGNGDEIAALRDFILTEALDQPAAPDVIGFSSFKTRAKWEWQQRIA